MASRIEEKPLSDGDRCRSMYLKSDGAHGAIRYNRLHFVEQFMPIIAKGNRFDDVEVWY